MSPALLLLAWGALWWAGAGLSEANIAFQGSTWASPLQGLWIGASAWLVALIAARLDEGWRGARWLIIASVPIQLLLIMAAFDNHDAEGVWRSLAAVAWPLALGATWLGLRTLPASTDATLNLAHTGFIALLATLASWAMWDLVLPLAPEDSAWRWAPWGLAPALLALSILKRFTGSRLATAFSAWHREGPLMLIVWALLWSLLSIMIPGRAAPLPFVPLLNPLELTQWLCVFTAAYIALVHRPSFARIQLMAAAGVAFMVVTAMIPRAAHHYAQVPWDVSRLFANPAVQTSVSVLWTLLAGAAMVIAHRRTERNLWLGGAVLLAVVVIKLFTVDLADSGNLMRIVSFLSVGALVLVIGYFAPLPPTSDAGADGDSDGPDQADAGADADADADADPAAPTRSS